MDGHCLAHSQYDNTVTAYCFHRISQVLFVATEDVSVDCPFDHDDADDLCSFKASLSPPPGLRLGVDAWMISE